MTHARRWIALAYCLPATVAVVLWIARHPATYQAPAIAAATFGSLLVLVLVLVLVVPLALRWRGHANGAYAWRRAAVAALPYPVFFTVVWGLLAIPLDAAGRVALVVAGAALTGLALWWARRTEQGPHAG